jgi:hypothetical protein
LTATDAVSDPLTLAVAVTVAVELVLKVNVSGVASFLMCLFQVVTEPDFVAPLAVYQVVLASHTVGPRAIAEPLGFEEAGPVGMYCTAGMSFAPFVPSAAGADTVPPPGGSTSA